jgi:carbon monoxide dehydrogenase subunit G
MEIRNTAHIAAPPESVWASIADVEGIVPCIPGASLTERVGVDRYRGEFRVKVGPLGLTLAGEVAIVSADEDAREMRLQMTARDRRGLGQANAAVVLTVSGGGAASELEIVSDTTLAGPVAQFGRPAIITAIGSRILAAFARCLESRLGSASPEG